MRKIKWKEIIKNGYIVIHNRHPGGEEILIQHKGQDATEIFECIGHSDRSKEMMKEYEIGILDTDSQSDENEGSDTDQVVENQIISNEIERDFFYFGKKIFVFGVGFILIPVICYLLFFYK
ncbi:hypothetical protein CWI39_0140p0020 [Hamiltosporidium magnivora]|uniref:Cytochrome b5 heme-binding domain-containing protein n=1 Tax=Hamiltosporidium magnivora TaxID=148818 RepID=A0A4V2JWQ0_9MICR|nr:hypothetical protein CWI39_0140p0020 [Hamiltosporidium magnivora]